MLEAHQKGRLTLRTKRVGQCIQFIVGDDGPGIAEEHLDRVFDPFFTTKRDGKGTGIGLSISFSIVQEHGGTIRVQSAPGQGTEFVVELPIMGPTKNPVAEDDTSGGAAKEPQEPAALLQQELVPTAGGASR